MGSHQGQFIGIFEELGDDAKEKMDLVTNPVNKAGFDSNCKLHGHPVTQTLTIEIENMRSQSLKKRIQSAATSSIELCKCLSYLQSSKLNSQFITSLPAMLGIMSEDVFLECMHQYLSFPSPTMKSYLRWHHYIRRINFTQEVNEYGINRWVIGGNFP